LAGISVSTIAEVKVLIVSFSYPPVSGPGLDRALELARTLPALGIETHVLARDADERHGHEEAARVPTQAWVHRARHLGPEAALRESGEEPDSDDVFARIAARVRWLGRQALQPDEYAAWNLTAIPSAVRLVRSHRIDGVVTVAPPHSVHLAGAAVKRVTGAAWLADLGERPGDRIAWLVSRRADAIACGSEEIAEAMRARSPGGHVVSIRGGDDDGSTADLLRSLA
jgi:hypothetical protein